MARKERKEGKTCPTWYLVTAAHKRPTVSGTGTAGTETINQHIHHIKACRHHQT